MKSRLQNVIDSGELEQSVSSAVSHMMRHSEEEGAADIIFLIFLFFKWHHFTFITLVCDLNARIKIDSGNIFVYIEIGQKHFM